MKGVRGVITPWVILGGGWINLSVTGIGEVHAALRLHSLDLQIGGFLTQLRLARVERHLKIEGIDDVEHVALVNVLVVNDPDFRDLPRHLGRDARDLHADAAVSRPGRGDIGVPDDQRGEHGEDEDEQGRRPLERDQAASRSDFC
jgi:hypothetical protein